MDISVIVPIYGVEKYISQCLHSLFRQTKVDGVEFILVNDCTKDKSMEVASMVIADFPDVDVKIINHEVNQGVAVARQTALDAATGEYTIHIDPDDYCEHTMLEEMYRKAKEDDADILFCDYYRSYSDRKEYQSKPVCSSDNLVNLLFRGKINNAVWNKLIKRSIYIDNNITCVKGINIGEDFVLLSKILPLIKRFSYLPKAFYYYKDNEG